MNNRVSKCINWHDMCGEVTIKKNIKINNVTIGNPVRIKITPSSVPKFSIGNGLKFENNMLSVDTADIVEKDNTKPVTSAAVYAEIGNIEALLAIL